RGPLARGRGPRASAGVLHAELPGEVAEGRSMSTDPKGENGDRAEPNPDITIRHDRLIAVITIAVVSGTVLGACAMFYLLKAGIITSEFDPGPFLLFWLFLVGVWGLGRLFPVKR